MPMRPASHAQRMRSLLPKPPDDRPSSSVRGYDAAWRKLRRWFLNRHPLCMAEGCELAATDVDHITPLERGGARLDQANLQALCHSHHSQKTAKQDGGFGRGKS